MVRLGIILFVVTLLAIAVLGDDPKVRILTTDPPVDPISGYIIQEKDKDVQLTCVVENKPLDINVLWLVQTRSNSTPIQISTATRSLDAFRWALDRPSPTSWRLRIQNVQVTDEGMYMCRVQVVTQNYVVDQRELRVVQKPQISDLDTSSDMSKAADDTAKLECYARGRPNPLIKWTRMAGELLPNGGTEFQGNVLSVNRVQADHAGIYKCTAENSAGTDTREIRVTVSFRPVVDANQQIVNQAVGYQRKLVCNIKGYPPPVPEQIAWVKEGRPVISDSRVQVRNIPGASNRITSIVDIRDVISSDFGSYRCSATNEKGTSYVTISFSESKIPTGPRASAAILSFNIATILMLVTVCLLQRA
jgi:limbic system-associated membrane protein